MMAIRHQRLTLFAIAAMVVWSAAADDGPSFHGDIVYAEAPEGVPQDRLTLDVYTEESAADRPVIVFFHGGGVDGGDKGAALAKPARFVGEGYVFVSANRRWVRMPGPGDGISDSVDAVRWVKDHIAEYGGDPSRLFLMGHSAGAALAALLVTDERHLERRGLEPADVRAVSIIDTGGIDKPRQKREAPMARVVRLYAELGMDDEDLEQTSAMTFLGADRGIPPMILHCGGARRICEGFGARLHEVGVDADVHGTHGKTHGGINRDLGADGDAATEEILAFFGRHGGAAYSPLGREPHDE
jgi:acetyl esterase/lipase